MRYIIDISKLPICVEKEQAITATAAFNMFWIIHFIYDPCQLLVEQET